MTREEAKTMLPFIQAYAEGKAIESRCIKGDKSLWYDDEDPSFDDDFEYRIKPEPNYRPFKDAERLKQCSVLKCCGNCQWFDNEDVYGVGWCSNNGYESSCDQVCSEHEF